MKKISSKEVLQIIADIVRESIPTDKEGNLHLRYDDDDNIEIFFLEKTQNIAQA